MSANEKGKPLLEKIEDLIEGNKVRFEITRFLLYNQPSYLNSHLSKLLNIIKSDVLECVKKFINGIDKGYLKHDQYHKYKHVCYSCSGIGLTEDGCAYYKGKFYCIPCWFKECFGVLPVEKEVKC